MKKFVYLLLIITGFAKAQIVYIPDPVFKAKLLSADVTNTIASTDIFLNNNLNPNNYVKIDTNDDGEIQLSEASLIKYINVSGTYNLNGGISDLTGIEAFVNLKFLKCYFNFLTNLDITNNLNLSLLNCSFNQLNSIDITNNINLNYFSCVENQLVSLDVLHNLNLNTLDCSFNQLTNLSVIQNSGLLTLDCSGNFLTSLDVDNLTYLVNLYCSYNSLTTIDISNNHNLMVLECYNNQLTAIDLSNNLNLTALNCSFNTLSNIDVNLNSSLSFVDCSNNLLTNLSLNNNSQLNYLFCRNNQLTELNIKNGAIENPLDFSNNPNLTNICADENQISSIQAQATSSVIVSSYCSFIPGGNYNTISGVVRFDMDGNGCDASDLTLPNSVCLNLTNGTVSSGTFPTTDGSYTLYTTIGSHTLNTVLENPTYFSITPTSSTFNLPTLNGGGQIQDFCIAAIGLHPDLEIVIAPIASARPGFDATYKIIYRNKGNQTLSGNISFNYNDSVLDYISGTVTPDSQSTGNLIWNYTNLLPFESRSFIVTLNVNSPTETPPVNIGDVLSFTAIVNPFSGDELPLDNTFALNQTVVGSFDPNDKTCLEGNFVSPTKIGDYLHYNINFENIGTFPATFVVVKDMIDTTKFDINSLLVMNSSHPMITRINGNKVEFIFENINLGANQHGNVTFKIKTKSTLITGNTVTNNANIYFDYNAPILTNTASTIFQALNNGQFVIDNSIVVSPNPTKGNVVVISDSIVKSIQLYDVQGRLLETKLTNDTNEIIDISEKSNGIYFLKITSELGSKVEKIVKK